MLIEKHVKTALVVGAGSGIGSALVDRLADSRDIGCVVAASRRPVSSFDRKVRWRQLDVVDATPREITEQLTRACDRVDLLFVTVGVLHDRELAPEKSLRALDTRNMQRVFAVNAAAPLGVLAGCMPLLTHPQPSVACVLSAQVGSIEDNRLGGWYAYRMSKAALNMGIKTISIEVARERNHPIVLAVHPGTTRTSLSSPFLKGNRPHVSARTTAERLIKLAACARPEDHGAFVDWRGTALPW